MDMKMMNRGIRRWTLALTGIGAAVLLAACGGGGGSASSSSGPTPTGMLQMSVTDAPACYDHVIVNVAKLRVHMSDDTKTGDADPEWRDIVPANAPVQVDLVNLTNGQLKDLGNATVPAGTYRQVRLVLASTGNTVTPVGGTAQPLNTPSGQESGLKIKADFSVLADQTNDLLMDFDACKSIVLTGSGKYILKPVVRLGAKPAGAIQGFVSGTVTSSTVNGTTTTTTTGTLRSISVSAQQDGTVIRSTIPDATGKFMLSYLPAGTYTVVVTGSGVSTSGTLDTTRGAATRVIDSVPVAASTVSLNTSTTSLVLSPSAMSTVSGTITASTKAGNEDLGDDARVSAMQTVGTRLVEVNGTRQDDDKQQYTLRLPLAAPELQLFSASGLPAPTADSANAAKYTIRAWGPGLATKETDTNLSTGPQVVNFSY
jgi:hypothetical protein